MIATGNHFDFDSLRGAPPSPTNAHKKTAPGIPGTVLQEPYSFYRKGRGLVPERVKLAFRAIAADIQRRPQIQAGKAHIAGGIGHLVVIKQIHLKGLGSGQPDKFLHFLKRADTNPEFLHKIPP
jgi:hypothetical protein